MSYGVLDVGGVLSTDYEIFVLGVDDANIPVRDYSVYSIPGKSRDIHYDNGRFENIDRIYHLYARAFGGVPAEEMVRSFCADLIRLKGYQKISDSIHPDYYKLGEFRGGVEPSFSPLKDGVHFNLTFDCDARKYLKIGTAEIDISNTGSGTLTRTIINPGTLPASPLVLFSGISSSGCTVSRGSASVAVSQYQGGTLVFDCELGDAYDLVSHANLNSYVTVSRDLIELSPGVNTLGVGAGATITIIPRWNSL